MINRLTTFSRKAAGVAALGLLVAAGSPAAQAAEAITPPDQSWGFEGIFGKFDRAAMQRGLQVYTEVCKGCHSLSQVAYRNLSVLGLNEDEIKAYAAEYEVPDGPDEEGEMFTRPALPADKFAAPFPNDNAAKAANGGALPPDLSLITKARANGHDYLYALLTGYADEAPEGIEVGDGLNYNAWFPGFQIAMAQPLYEDQVEYADGTPATIEQMSQDVTEFLAWAAEPELEQRKGMGVTVFLFLIVFLGLAIAYKKALWKTLH